MEASVTGGGPNETGRIRGKAGKNTYIKLKRVSRSVESTESGT